MNKLLIILLTVSFNICANVYTELCNAIYDNLYKGLNEYNFNNIIKYNKL